MSVRPPSRAARLPAAVLYRAWPTTT